MAGLVYNRSQLDSFLHAHVSPTTQDLISSALTGGGIEPTGAADTIYVLPGSGMDTFSTNGQTNSGATEPGSLFLDLDQGTSEKEHVYTLGDSVVSTGDSNDKLSDYNTGTTGDTLVGGTGKAGLYSETPTGQAHTGNTLLGGSGMNSLYGAGGDVLRAYNGAGSSGNTLYGHGDTLYGGSGADKLVAKEGHNTLYGGSGHSTLIAGGGDQLFGSTVGSGTALDDVLKAKGDNNTLTGGSQYDRLYGGPGNNNTLYGGTGRTDVHTGTGSQGIIGGSGDLHVIIDAGSVSDTITSGSGKNYYQFNQTGFFHESSAAGVTTVTFSDTQNGAATQTVTITGDITKLSHPHSHT